VSRILLDTEALIWWDANDPRLGGRARAAIQEATEVFVSAASAWEIVIKEALGKLRTKRAPSDAIAQGGLRPLPISFEHAEAVRQLVIHHKDPFDRLIIATATVEGLTVLTNDEMFSLYGVPLIDARK
jgi:PIN domain nuclease of toxin-antitoxin system